ncbi:MAG: OsmC family protein [Candidatus Omnitrophica bacterium]|nr:OsmC family protein [Candidatus Omnitrophota bacterium]
MYKVQVIHNQDLAFTVKTNESEFIIDAKGKGLTPLDALLAGLGSCIGVYIRKYAEGSKLNLNNFQVSVSAELSKESPATFKQINVAIDLNACQLDDRRQRALLEFIKHCPAHNTLKGNPEIEFKIQC